MTAPTEEEIEAHIKRLTEMADGFDNAAYIEVGVQALLEPDYRNFHEGDRTPLTLRRVMAGNESRDAHARYVKDSKAIRAAIEALDRVRSAPPPAGR